MRALRIAGWTLFGILFALAVLLFGLPNTDPGRRLLAQSVGRATGGMVAITGLSGRFPDRLRIAHLDVRDAAGVWISADDLALDWSPTALAGRLARIEQLSASRIAIARLPASSASNIGSGSNSGFTLPVRVDLQHLHVARLELAADIAGRAAVVGVDGRVALQSATAGSLDLRIETPDGAGSYRLSGHADTTRIDARLHASEPAGGLVGGLAGLPDLGALALDLDAAGPWQAVAARAGLAAGAMRATAVGTVDAVGRAAVLDLDAHAPAMQPRPDLGWQSVALRAHVTGPFTRPSATGRLDIQGLAAQGASAGRVGADLSGDATGRIAVDAGIDGLRIPGARPELFAAAPLRIKADIRLDAADRPVALHLSHPLLALDGTLHVGDAKDAAMDLTIADFSAFGVDLHGHAGLHLTAALAGEVTKATVAGRVSVDGGMAPAPALIGQDADIAVEVSLDGSDVRLGRLHVSGAKLGLDGSGELTGGRLDAKLLLTLPDLAVAAPGVGGTLRSESHITGALDALSLDTKLSGAVSTAGFPATPIEAALHADGLPGAPSGSLTARATLEGAALTLAGAAQRLADGTLKLAIDHADWKSAHAEGTATLPPGAAVPQAHIVARMQRLADLRGLTGADLGGSFSVVADIDDKAAAKLRLEARDIAGADRITLLGDGPATALVLKLDVSGMGAVVASQATLDMPARRLALSRLQGTWKGEQLALLAPSVLSFADGVAVDRLRLGLRGGVLDVAGRLSPSLDATASLRNLPFALADVAMPGLGASGTLSGEAKLTGTTARPTGTVQLAGAGLRVTKGAGAALPPATVTARATLAGSAAQVDVRAGLGGSRLSVTGRVPIGAAGSLALRASGAVDLTLFDPLLAADARRVRGQATLDAGIGGTLAAPRVDGTLRLAGGEVQDLAQGVRIHDIQALLRANGDSLRIEQFAGVAGGGTIGLSGSVGLAAPMPVNLQVTARNASPVASERLTVVLDSLLALRGSVEGGLSISGTVGLQRAEIRVPERLPTSVAVLNVRRPGDRPPPAVTPGPAIGLDLSIDAPGRIFVRGRGIDAELGGTLKITGTAAAPRPQGSVVLRHGTISFAGTTLTFTSGTVGLDGSGRLDPTLDFKATSASGGIVATLSVTGTASAPKLGLSSVPELPQDEVLAHLLFGTSMAKLGPLQIAQIAAALAEVAGVGGSGFQPLESIRKGLGLDRLSVGSGGDKTGTLEAGRYVAPGVYVGAKQGLSGAGTQATVQIDLYKGLKLEADLGASSGASNSTGSGSSGGSGVGLTYQFDY